MKRIDDRGFSLVELIIVIAIMAVLTAVLAPQFLKYIEDSRVQKDESLFSEIEHAAQVACSVREIYDALPPGDSITTVTITDNAQVTADVALLQTELQKTVPDIVHFSSKKYRNAGSQTVSIRVDATRQIVVVSNSWTGAES